MMICILTSLATPFERYGGPLSAAARISMRYAVQTVLVPGQGYQSIGDEFISGVVRQAHFQYFDPVFNGRPTLCFPQPGGHVLRIRINARLE